MRTGYNTNGFAHHRLEDAISILAEIGYQSIALTLDYHALNPYDPQMPEQRRRVARLLERHNLHCVIETGGRFLLDPRRKHSPTLLDDAPPAPPTPSSLVQGPPVRESLPAPSPAGIPSRASRLDFLTRAIDLASDLRADAVAFWSGAKPPGLSDSQAMSRMVEGCRRLLDAAERRNIRLAFEPEPGMFIDRMEHFAALHAQFNHPLFGLTLDIGHIHCLNDGPIPARIDEWQNKLFNIHIEDMRRGVHDHLPFGEGEIDFPPVFAALRETGYTHGLHVELSRHSHDAVNAAGAAYPYITKCMQAHNHR